MTPQLWKRNLEWLEWRQMHPDLEEREAQYLYQVEQKMFQNYQDEVRNQMSNRRTRLVGDLMNLSADISSIINRGGKHTKYTYRSNFVDSLDGFKRTGGSSNSTLEYNQTNPYDNNSEGWLKVSLTDDLNNLYIYGPNRNWTGLPRTDTISYPPEFYGGFSYDNITFGDSFLPGGKNDGWYAQIKYDIVIASSVTPIIPPYVEIYTGGVTNQYDPTDGNGSEMPENGNGIILGFKQTVNTGIVPLNPYGDEFSVQSGPNFVIVHPLPSSRNYHPNPLPNGLIFYIKNVEYNIWDRDPRGA